MTNKGSKPSYQSVTCRALAKTIFILGDGYIDFQMMFELCLIQSMIVGCGHCKQMKPEYTEAAKTLKDEGVKAITINQ